MPKRRSVGREGGRATKRRRRQHLYLVLDDWLWGYSIRKLDLSSDHHDSDDNVVLDAATDRKSQRLPRAVFRLEAPHGSPEHFTAAFGTKIMALHPWEAEEMDTHPMVPRRVAPAFDVRTRAMSLHPRPKGRMSYSYPIYIPVGNSVLALLSRSCQLLCPPPPAEAGSGGESSWCKLSKPAPFKSYHVTSYAAHPDGRTVFVSTKRRKVAATFSLDTAEQTRAEWKNRGDWVLPFIGRAHFDRDLDAWVGLSGDPDTAGHVCAVEVVVPDDGAGGDGRCSSPGKKLSNEKLFGDPVETQVGANLVYMGGGGRFCLVQCIGILADDEHWEEEEGLGMEPPQYYHFRLTTFSLKYDKNGDLTTGNSRRVRYYEVPDAATQCAMRDIVAFWM